MFFTQKMMQFKLINNFINNNNNNNPINRVNSMNEKILYKNNSFFNSDSLENKLSIFYHLFKITTIKIILIYLIYMNQI